MKHPWDAEAGFLVACLRAYFAPADRAPPSADLPAEIDWARLVGYALAHRVVPLLYAVLSESGPNGVPQELLDAMQTHAERNSARNGELVAELRRLVDRLAASGVPAIPFKGPTLVALAYGDGVLREAGDLDILVREEHIDRFVGLLVESGYEEDPETAAFTPAQRATYQRYQSQYFFVRPADSMMVEPHWRISPTPLAIQIDREGLWARSIELALAGGSVSSLGLEDLLIVLCVHGSKHRWEELRWVCDIAALMQRQPQIDWHAVQRRAAEQGCERMVLLGVALAGRLLGVSCPAALQRRMAADRPVAGLADRVCRELFIQDRTDPSPFEFDGFRFRMRERRRDRLAYLCRTLFTARVEKPSMLPFRNPSPLFRVPVDLVHDYVLLPLWQNGLHRFRLLNRGRRRRLAAEAKSASRAAWSDRATAWVETPTNRCVAAETDIDEALLEAAAVGAGDRVLDLASGAGDPALTLAERVGADGFVIASDLIEQMAAAARRRAAERRLGNLTVCVADMGALPFADASMDAVVCRFGIMFSDRVDAVLAEIGRLLRPGARLALAVWGPREENTQFEVLQRVLAPLGRGVSSAPAAAGLEPFRFGQGRALARLVEQAGFADVREIELRFASFAPEGSRFWSRNLQMLAGSWVSRLPPAARHTLDTSLEREFADCLTPDGYRLRNHVRIVAGTKPEGAVRPARSRARAATAS